MGEWRTGAEHVDDLPSGGGYPPEMAAKPAYGLLGGPGRRKGLGDESPPEEGSAAD